MIQAVIARLAGNAFLMKGWAITLAAGAFGFAVSSDRWLLALVAVITTIAFWALDAYFLRCERLFRELHSRVAGSGDDIQPFFMGATSPAFVKSVKNKNCNYWAGFWSGPLGYFYIPLLGTAAIVAFVVGVS
jgi:hypothetical protein